MALVEALQHQDEYVFICKRCGDDLGIKYVEQPAQKTWRHDCMVMGYGWTTWENGCRHCGQSAPSWFNKPPKEKHITTYEQPHGWMQQLVSETDGKKTIRYTFTKTKIGKNDIPIYFEEALEQPTKEPVAWLQEYENENGDIYHTVTDERIGINDIPVYTHPAPSWQGLSNDRIREIGDNCLEKNNGLFNWIEFARAIEQASKEKNKVTEQ